jgi:hypothetical protein
LSTGDPNSPDSVELPTLKQILVLPIVRRNLTRRYRLSESQSVADGKRSNINLHILMNWQNKPKTRRRNASRRCRVDGEGTGSQLQAGAPT